MAEGQISKERIEAIIAAYGADPERWPGAERADVLAQLERSGEWQGQVREAAELDVLLQGVERPQPANMLKAKLLDDASQAMASNNGQNSRAEPSVRAGWMQRLTELIFEPTGLRPLALGGVMMPVLVLGMWLGVALTSEPLGDEELFAAFGEDYELWTDSNLVDPSEELTGET